VFYLYRAGGKEDVAVWGIFDEQDKVFDNFNAGSYDPESVLSPDVTDADAKDAEEKKQKQILSLDLQQQEQEQKSSELELESIATESNKEDQPETTPSLTIVVDNEQALSESVDQSNDNLLEDTQQ